jgi:peptidyl-prolyl cis-trans isomerase A (cyclophilin A)
MRAHVWALALACACLIAPAQGDDYTVRFVVQIDAERRGEFAVTVREGKAPIAAQRFRELVNSGFFNGAPFFRVLPGFIVQFGLSGNTTMQREWDAKGFLRDENRIEHPDWNMRGTIAFANSGPNSRATQVFINYDDNHQLDSKGIVPFGRLVSGMSTLSAIYSGYRERPSQAMIRQRGNAYLWSEFPRLSYISYAQQVAFVEEPFQLSKNQTGMVITFGMVLGVAFCCLAARLVQRRLANQVQVGELIRSQRSYTDPTTACLAVCLRPMSHSRPGVSPASHT